MVDYFASKSVPEWCPIARRPLVSITNAQMQLLYSSSLGNVMSSAYRAELEQTWLRLKEPISQLLLIKECLRLGCFGIPELDIAAACCNSVSASMLNRAATEVPENLYSWYHESKFPTALLFEVAIAFAKITFLQASEQDSPRIIDLVETWRDSPNSLTLNAIRLYAHRKEKLLIESSVQSRWKHVEKDSFGWLSLSVVDCVESLVASDRTGLIDAGCEVIDAYSQTSPRSLLETESLLNEASTRWLIRL